MKTYLSNISPYLLLLVPVIIAVIVIYSHVNQENVQEHIKLNASFIALPDVMSFKAFLFQ